MRGLRVVVVLLVLAAPTFAHGDAEVQAGAGLYRCADAHGRVPGGTAEIFVCADYEPGTFTQIPWIEAPYAFVLFPQPVTGSIRITTSRGSDYGSFYFNPFAPNPDVLMAYSMDAAMTSAQITVTVGSVSAKVTLASNAAPQPQEGVRFSRGEDTSLIACGDIGAGASIGRAATVVTGSTITSTKVGGGALTSAPAEMFEGVGGGASAGLYPAPNWFVMC